VRVLLLSSNNSLSHTAKALALREALERRGQEVVLAAAAQRSPFLCDLGIPHRVLPDIQEVDRSPAPTPAWFRRPARFEGCVAAERRLIDEARPDRVVGIFRFTSRVSTALTGVPYDSLVCGCMLPEFPDVLGFAPGEPGAGKQDEFLRFFYRTSARRLRPALHGLGHPEVEDVRSLLHGDRTFLWDIPEFCPLPRLPDTEHVGPVFWSGWQGDPRGAERLARPLAVVACGTAGVASGPLERVARLLAGMGFSVLFAAGPQEAALEGTCGHPRIRVSRFAPMTSLLAKASLLVCHGGQLSVFEALAHCVPVAVVPFQPEQAHNGLCLERINCGCRLVPPVPFRGNRAVYLDVCGRQSDQEIRAALSRLVEDRRIRASLEKFARLLAHYSGADTVAERIVEGATPGRQRLSAERQPNVGACKPGDGTRGGAD